MRLFCLIAILLIPGHLRGEEAGNPLKIELISEARSIQAGTLFFLGLHLKHPAGTHTYWKNPGIVGLATTVDWELPEGFKAGEIQWPAPQVVKMAGHQAQGYEGETLLMIPITPPDVLAGSSVEITAKVSWMCCGKTCHPAVNVPFSIRLPIDTDIEPDPSTQDLFLRNRALVPKPDPSWKVTAHLEHGKIVISLRPPVVISKEDGIRFFTSDGQVDSDQKQECEILPDGSLRMTLAPAELTPETTGELSGVIVFPRGWRDREPSFRLEIVARF